MSNVAVKTNSLCKGFGEGETRIEVLKDINFEARLGKLLMLAGPSGCGKTTLLSVIAGTLGVDRGEVEVFDSPLHRLDMRAVTRFRAANIGFIFQQYNLIPIACQSSQPIGCRSNTSPAAGSTGPPQFQVIQDLDSITANAVCLYARFDRVR